MNNQDEKINWVTVINFLEKEYSQMSMREKEWKYEKEVLTQRISTLQAELRSNTIVCEDLVNRIRILQIALKEEKSKKNGKAILDQQEIKSIIDKKFNLAKQIQKCSHEQFLKDITKDLKFLQEAPLRLTDEFKEEPLRNPNQVKISQKRKFGAHLDVITALISLQNNNQPLFATSSQDCLIKIWNLSSALKQDAPQPKHTLRKHTGPLFSLTGGINPHNKSQHILFSGGIQGDIKSWRVEKNLSEWTGNWLNGTQQQQTIWQLQMREDKLLSASSDGFIRLFKINHNPKLQLSFIKQFKEKQFNHVSTKFVSDQLLLASCSSAPRIHLYDMQGKICQKYLYESEKGKQFVSVQANKVEINKDCKMVIGGCQDGFVRLFDYTSTKIIKKLQTSTSITSLLAWDWQIAGGDHKGSLHIWDSRMFKLLQYKENLHLQKYQTGLTSISKINNYLLTTGADGIVKIFN